MMTDRTINIGETFQWTDITRINEYGSTNLQSRIVQMQMSNGELKEVNGQYYRCWARVVANPKTKKFNPFHLVRCIITGSFATDDKALRTQLDPIAGWCDVDGYILPVLPNEQHTTLGEPYAVLNIKTGKVWVVGGYPSCLAVFNTLAEYEHYASSRAGITPF